MTSILTSSVWPSILPLLCIGLTAHVVRIYLKLRDIPGPFWARITNLPRVSWVYCGRSHHIHMELHERYGPCVRLGPHMVSVSDPEMIPVIYPMRSGFPKGDFYRTLMPYTRAGAALPAVFNTRDEDLHKRLKSPIASIFSLTNVMTLELFVDEVLLVLFEQLERRFVRSSSTCDLGDWLQYFAFEVMASMTFSRRYGFLEFGSDRNGLIEAIWRFMKVAAPITQIPWFDYVWNKNPIAAKLRPTTGMPIIKIALNNIAERRRNMENALKADSDICESARGDMLDHFLKVQIVNPSIPAWAPTAWTFSNLNAGSDSTAVVMRTIWFHLLKDKRSLKRLLTELFEAKVSMPLPKWAEVRDLQYLNACVNEAVRLHPPFCLPFERVVPKGGIVVCGTLLPENSIVGMNPWVVNRDGGVFGGDAEIWRPERWTKCNGKDMKKMEQTIMTFGAGRRVCLGKNIAILELKKLTSALLLNFEFILIDPESYKTENFWFFRQLGLKVLLRKRQITPSAAL